MKTTPETVKLDSIDSYNRLYGLETRHPLISVFDLKNATRIVNNIRMDYGVYALYLKNGINCSIKYGRQHYDYQEGTIVSFSPGQLIEVSTPTDEVAPDVIGLMFHPDLLYGTPLADKMSRYSFFDYSQLEALHLSEAERRIFMECLERINEELEHPVDSHTSEILASHLQVLLDYLTRFYERQFTTRKKVNSDILSRFEKALRQYYAEGRGSDGIPSVAYFADVVSLTPGYFGDMVKRLTGKTPQELITLHIIDIAKRRLAASEVDISLIAYDLGFQHPNHFSRMFKRATGKSPSEFRSIAVK